MLLVYWHGEGEVMRLWWFTFRCQRNLGVTFCFPSHLRQGLCSCLRLASVAVSFWRLYCLHLLSHHRNSGVIDSCNCARLYVGSGDLSSGPQGCSTSVLVTKPSPQLRMAEVFVRSCPWNFFLRFPTGLLPAGKFPWSCHMLSPWSLPLVVSLSHCKPPEGRKLYFDSWLLGYNPPWWGRHGGWAGGHLSVAYSSAYLCSSL